MNKENIKKLRKKLKKEATDVLKILLKYHTKLAIQKRAKLEPCYVYSHIGSTKEMKPYKIEKGNELNKYYEELNRIVDDGRKLHRGVYNLSNRTQEEIAADKAVVIPTNMSNIEHLLDIHKNTFATKPWR